MAATAVTLNNLEGHSLFTGFFKCNPSNICAAFYTISTDSVLARSLWSEETSMASKGLGVGRVWEELLHCHTILIFPWKCYIFVHFHSLNTIRLQRCRY